MSATAPLLVLTGSSGSGKTTLCRRLVAAARAAGLDAAGILSPARVVDGRKVGIDALDPRSGRSRPFASLHAGTRAPGVLMGPWTFDEAAVEWGNALLRSATPCDLLVVDELGSLEFVHHRGWLAGFEAVGSGGYRQAVVVVRNGLVGAARARWPHAEVEDASDAEARRRLEVRLARMVSAGDVLP